MDEDEDEVKAENREGRTSESLTNLSFNLDLVDIVMYRRVMAFDFDGTLAVNGDVPPEVEMAPEQCRAGGTCYTTP